MMASPTGGQPLPPPKGPPPQHQQHQPFPQYQEQLPSPPGQRYSHQQLPQQHQQQPYPPQFAQQQQQQPYPQQQQQQVRPGQDKGRPRNFSFRSDKSQKSNGSHPAGLVETHAEKEAKRLHSKADPTMAMNEAEPAAVAATVKQSMASLRSSVHRDTFGNPIADPDRSNPTRSRWERPLDTIRSFEAAIDGGHNRKSFIRTESDSIANWNRRSSYYGNNPGRFPQDRHGAEGHHGANLARPNSAFMHSAYDLRHGTPGPARDSYFDQHSPAQPGPSYQNTPHGNAYNNGPQNGRQRYSRMASEPQFRNAYNQGEQNIYPMPNNGRSYETVASGTGSGASGEPAGYQTDPTSSDNSSIERVQSPPKRQPDPANDYGIGFSQSPTYQPPAFTVGVRGQGQRSPLPPGHPAQAQQNGMNGMNGMGPPPVPRKDAAGNTIMRKPTAPSMAMQPQQQPQQRPAMGEKRKSWFARTFSKG